MDLGLTGRRALILGSSQGLDHAIARTLSEEGAEVILCGRSAGKPEKAAAELPGGSKVRTDTVDLGDEASLGSFITRLADDAVDILVLNGGGPPPGPVASIGSEIWNKHFAAMVSAPLAIASALLPGVRARKFGRIVTIVSSSVQQPIPNLGVSNTLRSSMIGWAKTLAGEVAGDGVTVNSVVPGRIHTARVDELDAAAAARAQTTPQAAAEASRATVPKGATAIRANSRTRSPSLSAPARPTSPGRRSASTAG